MLVDVGNRKVGIWIQHDRRGLSGNFNEDRKQIQPCTKATVEIDGVNYHGIARLSFADKQFIKREGVKRALRRALQKTTLNKDERSRIWRRVWNNKYEHFNPC